MTDGLPSFPARRPGQDPETWTAVVAAWLGNGAVRHAYVVAAEHSGHGADVVEHWDDSARQARLLRGYLATKLGAPLPSYGDAGPPVDELDPLLVTAANGASAADAHAAVDTWCRLGTATLRRRVAAWRKRGAVLLAAYPDLGLDRPEPGRPRGLTLPDAPPPVDEATRVAPGTAPGSAAQVAALVAAAQRGDLVWSLLPPGVAAAVVAALRERAVALGRVAEVPAAAAETPDADAVVAALLRSPEWAAAAALLRAALDAAATVATLGPR
ncbi:hypothetical protein [Azospirillum endophyticum]